MAYRGLSEGGLGGRIALRERALLRNMFRKIFPVFATFVFLLRGRRVVGTKKKYICSARITGANISMRLVIIPVAEARQPYIYIFYLYTNVMFI